MNSIADATVIIQTSSESVPATPPWLSEPPWWLGPFDKQGVPSAIGEQCALPAAALATTT